MRDNEPELHTICICMGSSCYARGNARNAVIIGDHLARTGKEDRIELTGTLCEGRCRSGPNVRIDGVLHGGVENAFVLDLLADSLKGDD
jgi:NADH:ubiquinone oxidoreductase subunit E